MVKRKSLDIYVSKMLQELPGRNGLVSNEDYRFHFCLGFKINIF